MENKLISVIMSVYNNEDTLEESIISILDQTHKNIEFLITDDGSTDNSYQIINKFKEQDERVITFKNTTNIGLTKSLNNMIRYSKGDYIARQDADDISLKNRLETQMGLMSMKKVKISTSRAHIKNSHKKIPGISFMIPYKFLIYVKNPFIHGTLIIESSIMREYMYDENFIYAQDYELFTRLIKNKIPILRVKKPLYVLNTRNNISNLFYSEQRKFSLQIKKKLRKF
tara:strand:+ start:673 stop:1356 length:684 start_codon:yes stop_codon:yes gene_type:complete